MNFFIRWYIFTTFFLFKSVICATEPKVEWITEYISFINCYDDIEKSKVVGVYPVHQLINYFNPTCYGRYSYQKKKHYEHLMHEDLNRLEYIPMSLSEQSPKDYGTNNVNVEIMNENQLKKFIRPYEFNSTTIYFDPYTLHCGLYNLKILIRAKKEEDKHLILKEMQDKPRSCYFNVCPLQPFPPSIKGGNYRIISPGRIVILTGFLLHLTPKVLTLIENRDYLLTWSCTLKPTQPNDFCKTFYSTNKQVIIPKDEALDGRIFTIRLSSSVPACPFRKSEYFEQIIKIKANTIELEIICLKNCLPESLISSTEKITFITVKCYSRCYFAEKDYKWEIEIYKNNKWNVWNEDYNSVTDFGRYGPKFVISKNQFMVGRYRISVSVKNKYNETGRAVEEIHFNPVKTLRCRLDPEKGISYQTEFKLLCNWNKTIEYQANYVKLYRVDGKTGQEAFVYGNILPSTETFILPPTTMSDHFKAVSSKEHTQDISCFFRARVDPLFNSSTKPEQIALMTNYMYNTGQAQLNSPNARDRQNGLAALQIAFEHLAILNSSNPIYNETINAMKTQLLKDLEKMTMVNNEDITKVMDILTRAVNINKPKEVEPETFDITQTICEKIAKAKVDILKNADHGIQEEETMSMVRKTATCATFNSKPNVKLLKPVVLNETTLRPTVTESIVEDYVDYIDFQEDHYEHLEKYQSASAKAVATALMSAKAMSLGMVSGEKQQKQKIGKNILLVSKDRGKFLRREIYQALDIKVTPSNDWILEEHEFDILISVWGKDIAWWNQNETRVSSDIISIQFWHSSCQKAVLKFIEPINIQFKIKENITDWIINVKISDKVNVYRMELKSEHELRINFHNLTANDAISVVFFVNRYPRKQDFDNSLMILGNNTNNFISYKNHNNKTIFCYIGFLKEDTNELEIGISFVLRYCIRYDLSDFQWKPACEIGNSSTAIELECNCYQHFFLISTKVQSISTMKMDMIVADIQLQLQFEYIIVATVLGALSLYTIGLFYLNSCKKQEHVYFLADNRKKYSYTYFIVVHTSSNLFAGTSSNVVIQIRGDQHATFPHLLNYPDPQMRILQRNNYDTFVITTKRCLGNIKYLEIWFDSIGVNPSWHCQTVLVYDKQTGKEWYFAVDKKFDVQTGVTYVAVEPTDRKKHKYCRFRFNTCDNTHGWVFSVLDTDNLFKLTVLLSNILFTITITMFKIGLPELKLRDIIDPYENYVITMGIFLSGLFAAALSFVIHTGMAWLFRFGCTIKNEFLKLFAGVLLLSFLSASMTLLLVYGPFVPFNSSLIILTAAAIGLLISATVFENLTIVIRTTISHKDWKHSIHDKFNVLWLSTLEQQRYLFDVFGSHILRNYFSHLYEPMNEDEIQFKRMVVSQKRNYIRDLKDCFWFGIYLLLLYSIILLNKNTMSVVGNSAMHHLMEGKISHTRRFSKVTNIFSVYDYLEKTLIPVIHGNIWYGNFIHSEPGLMIDMCNKVLGVVRLRLHRMPEIPCKTPEIMKFMNMTECWPEYNFMYSATKAYNPHWRNRREIYRFYRLNSMFRYSGIDETGTLPDVGKFSRYTGGGYVAFLGRTLHNSLSNLRQMKQKGWIDKNTRGIFVEFLTYGTNQNEFNSVSLLIEQSATGYVEKRIKVQTVKMIYAAEQLEVFKYLLFIIFMFWVLMLLLKESVSIIAKIKTIFKDIWIYVDLFIIILSGMCIAAAIIRTNLLEVYLDELDNSHHNIFVKYFLLFYMEDFITIFAGILICVATIRIWKFLRFGDIFRMMEQTLILSAGSLFVLTIQFVVFLLSFGVTGFILYGDRFEEFHSLGASCRTLMLIIHFANSVNYNKFIRTVHVSYYFFSIYIFNALIFKTMFVVILMDAYRRSQRQFLERFSIYSVHAFFNEQIHYVQMKIHYYIKHLRGGGQTNYKNEFFTLKSGEKRFERAIYMNTANLRFMKNFTKCLLQNRQKRGKKKHTGLDFQLMLRLALKFLNKVIIKSVQWTENQKREPKPDTRTLFFKAALSGKKAKCIDSLRLAKIKYISEYILQPKSDLEEGSGTTDKLSICSKTIKKSNKMLELTALRMSNTTHKLDMIMTKLNKTLNIKK